VRRDEQVVGTRIVSRVEERGRGAFSAIDEHLIEQVLSTALSGVVDEAITDPLLSRAINPSGRSALTVARSNQPEPTYGVEYTRQVAVVIGINQYERWPKLEGAVGDARHVTDSLRRRGFDEVIELYDARATRQGILDALGTELRRHVAREDLAVVFFAGHGQTETLANGEKRGYIVPVDSDPAQPFATAISMDRLQQLSETLVAKHIYFVMDSCYSGLGFVRSAVAPMPSEGYVEKMRSQRAVQMITAGQEGEKAYERGGRGVFTSYWLEALAGNADFDGDGFVTASEIGAYVPSNVTAATGNRQTPMFGTLLGSGEIVLEVR
jgi:uncharacterized caspase-like protein